MLAPLLPLGLLSQTELLPSTMRGISYELLSVLLLRLWRRNKGWSVEKLADRAGIDVEEILEIEHDPHCEPETKRSS